MEQFASQVLPAAHIRGAEKKAVALVISALGLAVTAMLLYTSYFGGLTALLLRSMFFSLMAAAGLLVIAAGTRITPLRVLCYVLAVVALLPGPYLYENYTQIIRRGAIANDVDKALFVATMVIVLVMARAYIGRTMVAISVLALAYAYFGYLIPGEYGHSGYSTGRLASNLFLRTEGVFGIPMGVAAQYIFLFSFLGVLLMKSGLGQTFVDLAHALTGRVQGGPALTAVVSSTLFSSINGSAVAGVVTTGTFTIPLMKRAGYRAKTAGAIEAAASSAGQIMPPVMGAAAFLMAEMTGIPYVTIALAALIPALLYVLALLVAVRLEAGKFNMARAGDEDVPSVWNVLSTRGYMLAPLVVLVGFLIYGYTPMKSVVFAIAMALVIMPLSKATRVSPKNLLLATTETMRNTLSVVAAVATAGVLIGVLTLTGLALQISSLILDVGGDSMFLVLVFTMFASFILGLGLPTSAAYLLLAILVAPALEGFGLPTIAGHMFIFYYGLISAITPPVALAAYAGASIAGAGANETAFEAIRLGFVKLVIPFVFIYSPGLLLIGSPASIVLQTIAAVIGVSALATAFTGWLMVPLGVLARFGLVAGAALLLWPTSMPDYDPISLAIRLAGLALAGFVVFQAYLSSKSPVQEPART
ncbi:TRAP transporter 4TM/12TM fusion protein [Breoghania corrubedonensis]|uniref:TRAP transporter 4TM/12TM fusion protein n=1 Tax=Breoghania corrubedonensis TaxID=665038 RepID=A0A2T5VH18_9HYPH|nr:TRAP transporter fused permease subunit [Breoghania corrubedonensis]PTW63052.1 TRAP transporter 4TM/12TM fusion protein [Breoghania corrubedonensis]